MNTHILPKPDPESQSHSDLVLKKILEEISVKGPITFARYMEIALYAPGLGYYCTGNSKFGKGGDFVTAPEISPLFARCLAIQCHQILSELNHGNILELGAGSGQMACDLLLALEEKASLPEQYFIMDISPDLKQRQYNLFNKKIPHLLNKIQWLSSLPKEPVEGIIIGNEVLDAMPVHRFKQNHNMLQEFYVGQNDKKELIWILDEPQDRVLIDAILPLKLPVGYISEINLATRPWVAELSKSLKKGVMLFIDYGYLEEEYYHHQRKKGTLSCYFRHHVHDNPLILPGIQDITAHVNFTLLGNAALDEGLQVAGYSNQMQFLLNCGLLNLIEANSNSLEQFQINQQIKQLILPTEMGQLFKVMALTKNISCEMIGFQQTT